MSSILLKYKRLDLEHNFPDQRKIAHTENGVLKKGYVALPNGKVVAKKTLDKYK